MRIRRNRISCPMCGASAARLTGWGADRWMDRHEKKCLLLRALIYGRRIA